MPLKINGSTSGSVTLAAPATGSDVTLTLPTTALATLASPTFTGTVALPSTTTLDGVTLLNGLTTGTNVAGDKIDTSQTTTSSTYTDLATVGPTVTLTTGTSVLVIFGAQMYPSAGGCFLSLAVSGATTISASDANGWQSGVSGSNAMMTRAYILTGLTAGSNTFTLKYKASGGTGYYQNRSLVVARVN